MLTSLGTSTLWISWTGSLSNSTLWASFFFQISQGSSPVSLVCIVKILVILIFRFNRSATPLVTSMDWTVNTVIQWSSTLFLCIRLIGLLLLPFGLAAWADCHCLVDLCFFRPSNYCCSAGLSCIFAWLSSLVLKCSFSSSTILSSGLGALGDSLNCWCHCLGWPS